MKKNLQIAIDGPVAAGKGTVAALLAKKLGIPYINTGAMYRALAYLAKKQKIDLKDEKKLVKLFNKTQIVFSKPGKNNHLGYAVFLDGEEITYKIRTPEFGWGASVVASLSGVRKLMVKKQQELARDRSVIMEGRDITTRVLPKADLKIYLTASQEVRAKRRQEQFAKELGIKKSFKKVLKETKERDFQDTQRKIDPLTITPDAWVLDSTNQTIEETGNAVIGKLKEKGLL